MRTHKSKPTTRLPGWGGATLWRAAVPVVLAGLVPCMPPAAAQEPSAAAPPGIAPIRAPFPMPQLQRPVFADRVFSIVDHGAKAGEGHLNTGAFRKAIEACSESGGGTVLVPAGRWLTGAIHLRSNVNLHLEEGAVVCFPSDLALYLPVVHDRIMGVECHNYSPFIYAPHAENIAVTGKGTLEADGHWWYAWAEEHKHGTKQGDPREAASKEPLATRKFGKGAGVEGLRPSFIVPWKAKNVLIEGVTLRNIPLWAVRAVYTTNIIVRDISVWGVAGRHGLEKVSHNNAGVCLDSCRNGLVEYVRIETMDDAVVVRSGLNEDGLKINIPSENIVVRNYSATDIHTGSGGIVFGSETSGGIRNVHVHDAVFERADRGIRFKSTRGRGNVVEDIWIENIRMKDIRRHAISFSTSYSNPVEGGPAPLFRNIRIANVRCDNVATNEGKPSAALYMSGLPDMWLENFSFRDIRITNARKGAQISRARNITLENFQLQASKGPAVSLDDCRRVTLRHTDLQGPDAALSVRGTRTAELDVDVPAARVRFADDVDPAVVQSVVK